MATEAESSKPQRFSEPNEDERALASDPSNALIKLSGKSVSKTASGTDMDMYCGNNIGSAEINYTGQAKEMAELNVTGKLDSPEHEKINALHAGIPLPDSTEISKNSKVGSLRGGTVFTDGSLTRNDESCSGELSVDSCSESVRRLSFEEMTSSNDFQMGRTSGKRQSDYATPAIEIFVISENENREVCSLVDVDMSALSSGDETQKDADAMSETTITSARRQLYPLTDGSSLAGLRSCSSRLSILTSYSGQSDVTFWDPLEAVPHEDNYQELTVDRLTARRPTMHQLREELDHRASISVVSDLNVNNIEEGVSDDEPKDQPTKFGWIVGVLIRCLLNIFGVMLFLRMTWITGQAGIGLASVIILVSSLVTTVAAMSMSAICTNGEVHGGGAYYLTSRSLGPEFGGALGAIFTLANAVAVAMHVVGFAETLRDLINENDLKITGDPLHDVRLIGCITIVFLLGVVMVGLDFESKAQVLLLVLLIVSLLNYFVGTFIPPSEEKRRLGVVGYQGSVFQANFGPDFRASDGIQYDFFQVFAIFFPSATGILAGANISGDLKNPSQAIPRGTFLAILLTTLVYLGIVWTAGSCMLRDAVGSHLTASNLTWTLDKISACGNATCRFGLQNSHGIMGVASAFQPLIYAGIFSATLSSALACLVSAPKVLQALAKDKLFPVIGIFAKGYGENGEPRLGYVVTFFIAVAVTCIGSLDLIAPIISNFFLMSYTLINFACFDAAFANSPGFRPSFRFFNKWISLLGALLCLVIMFFLKWWAALATVIVVSAFYFYIRHRKPDVNWGSSRQARAYNDALRATLKLVNVSEHVKNFRPQILALTGCPCKRPALVDFAYSITKRQSLLICGQVFQGTLKEHLEHLRSTTIYPWFHNRHINAFYTNVAAPSLHHGVQTLLQSQGLGKLRPNTLMLGFKNNWQTAEQKDVHNYVGIIYDAFDLGYGVAVLRVPGGLDTHKFSSDGPEAAHDSLGQLDIETDSSDEGESDDSNTSLRQEKISRSAFSSKSDEGTVLSKMSPALISFKFPDRHGTVNKAYTGFKDKEIFTKESLVNTPPRKPTSTDFPSCLPSYDAMSINRFRGRQSGTIDVWWLFDDGGLGLLLPHILTTRKRWRRCKLRVFCAGTKKSTVEEDRNSMAKLLRKFRIDYSEIIVVPDIKRKPANSSYKEFGRLIKQWRLKKAENKGDFPWKISDADLTSRKEKLFLQLRVREKLLEHSKSASLIVVTLPVPRKFCPAGLYMAWLDSLTRDLPPTLLLRGNQESVLTYFS